MWGLVFGVVAIGGVVGVYLFWETIEESVLRVQLAKAMAQELGTTVSLEEFRVRSSGVRLGRLEVGNDPGGQFEAPYFARVGRLEVRTSGVLSLLSCGGTAKVGTARRQFLFGFRYRDIDEVVLEDVSIFVEEDEGGTANNAFLTAQEEREKARKRLKFKAEAKMIRDFKHKWRSSEADEEVVEDEDEDDLSLKGRLQKLGETMRKTKGRSLAERRDALLDLHARFRTADKENKEATQLKRRNKRDQDATLWRIGRVSVARCSVRLRGVAMSVDDWELRGFIGDTAKLKRKVITGIMQDLLSGIKDGAHKAIDTRIQTAKNKVATFKSRFLPGSPAPA